MELDARSLVVLALLVAATTLILARAIGRTWRSIRASLRLRRAGRGESKAEKILKRKGYRIEDRQVRTTFTFYVDGRPRSVKLRADLLVRRRGRRYVAEVKTGTHAPRPDHRATRRQLLEYWVAFDVDGLLLVDGDRGTVREIAFE